ncbi:hypothetical protein F4820DRAFT_414855 [Hypoxylon rubiginosum]|uniref:Uncharacterized protein n=1 Tax=Hypoxylon rubiginosum TaxID=110542 RepID=A0ACB9Z5J7_9PEZI|nr:hypothetical protein F4820DRAFT_414855 [Hypoxylon rubiginosum]
MFLTFPNTPLPVPTVPTHPPTMFDLKLLPAELRLRVWRFALQAETQNRLHMVGQVGNESVQGPIHLLPLKHHISPFLSVNKESRYEAVKFYYVKLDVYRAAEPVVCNPSRYEAAVEAATKDPRTTNDVKPAGVVYLNPQWDSFVQGENMGFYCNRCIDLGYVGGRRGTPRQDLTVRVTPELARTFRNVVLLERSYPDFIATPVRHDEWWYDAKDWVKYVHGVSPCHPHFSPPDRAKKAWKTQVFQGIRNFYHLRLKNQEADNFISLVNEMGGRGSLDIRKWVPYLDADGGKAHPGGWVLLDLDELQRQGRDMQRVSHDLEALWRRVEEL